MRILVVDDHEVVRQGVRAVLGVRDDWEICGEAADGRAAVDMARQLGPDLVILDVAMPDLNGLDAARQIHQALPGTEILILSVHDSPQMMRQAVAAGASGYVLKSDAGRTLVAAVEALGDHRTFLPGIP